eukprot:TRINITY_DN2890_c0_g1_i1.p1 TRINITY_DN2890_c0_g1~~TRINITY_DN2890_c0_g1_i1.p1  ORF type:complete len:503 (+),score=136.81 TRINITY_DN2890_c0_g1_i1:66-1574(+)
MSSEPLRGSWYGYVVLAAGFAVHICLGTAYTWGNLTTYVTSYMRQRDSSLTYADTVWAYFVQPFLQACTIFVGGFLQYLIGPRLTCLLGSALFSAGALLTAYTVEHGLTPLILSYGVLCGLGLGCAYTCPINTALLYLPHRRGFINGITVAGFGLGAFVFNFFITQYANPHNCKPVCSADGNYTGFTCPGYPPTHTGLLGNSDCPHGEDKYFPPDSEVAQRVPRLMLLQGFIFLGTTLGASLFIVRPDEHIVSGLWTPPCLTAEDDEEEEASEDTDVEHKPLIRKRVQSDQASIVSLRAGEGAPEVLTRDAVKSVPMWQLFFGFLFTGVGGTFIMSGYKSFGQDQSWSSDHFEQMVSSYMSVANALGRLVMGSMADRWGYAPVLLAMAIVETVVLSTFTVSSASKGAFVAWCFVCAFMYGGNFALYPTGTVELFGRRHFPTNYGVIFFGFGSGSLLISALNKSLKSSIGFGGMTVIGGVLCGAGAVNAAVLLWRRRRGVPGA